MKQLIITILIYLIIPLTSSFNFKRHEHYTYVHPTLAPLIKEFLTDMKARGIDTKHYSDLDSINLVGKFVKICDDENAIGCYDPSNNKITIRIPVTADTQDLSMYYRLTLYHEMGHGVLKMKHNVDNWSIMNPVKFMPLWVYRDVWTKLVNEYSTFYHDRDHSFNPRL